MPPKQKTPAPIDRPLSRAYLREFKGWSTAYPPGMSEPTSLRIMENMMINRDGSCRIRPGLRYFNYLTPPTDEAVGTAATEQVLGTHETFFTNDGYKAYLYAVREVDETVGFRVFADDGTGNFNLLTLAEAEFNLPEAESILNFEAGTTYVKYVQIDNKVFALSNNGEPMRMFSVGNEKSAQRLYSIERPDWDPDDKLTVVHPDAAWVDSGTPVNTRRNRVTNPTLHLSKDGWETTDEVSRVARTADIGRSDGYSLKLSSRPQRTNLCKQPLHNVASTGTTGWTEATVGIHSISASADYMRVRIEAGLPNQYNAGAVQSTKCDIDGDTRYRVGLTMGASTGIQKLRLLVEYFNQSGDSMSNHNSEADPFIGVDTTGRKESASFKTPTGAVQMKIRFVVERETTSGIAWVEIKNIYLGLGNQSTAALDGDDGADYFWTDGANNSASVYHPPQDVVVRSTAIPASEGDYYASVYARAAGGTGRDCIITVQSNDGSPTTSGVGVWTRAELGLTATAGTADIRFKVTIEAVPRDEQHYLDDFLLERANALDDYFDGSTPDAVGFVYSWAGTKHESISIEEEYSGGDTHPAAEVRTADTLRSSDNSLNTNSFGFFYTFSNEIGESAPSQTTMIRVQRPWSAWLWETPNASGEPSGTSTAVPELCADQLVAYIPQPVWIAALASGAIAWNLYMFTWSDQEAFPVTATLVQTRELSASAVYETDSWARLTPSQSEIASEVSVIPTKQTRINASDPSHGGQGLVAADRMALVFDPAAQAVIRWSSNQQGSYYDFSPSKGGGFKTLTSGNLQIPACVKLWQNPESKDTLTILMLGVDGHSTAYYMAPAQVASQSEAVNIMAFEETTATPGTTSPYGCEVLNNSLYHPLDDQLMKSTASNYNINHASQTEPILDMWQIVEDKARIVSAHLDNRLYYLVNNPRGVELEEGCWGNEVWVFDAAQKMGTWSRWLVQGQSLRKIERDGQIVMSLMHPTGIFYFDPNVATDDYVDDNGDVQTRNVPWSMETNTQGANRAHDAWANLQQANIIVGNFQGQMRYGIRGLDLHGKMREISKIVRDTNDPGVEAYDLEDYLLIRQVMKEWFFFAESVTEDDVTQHSSGQISLVQYRYTPSTVNTGYEYGSVETFEYGRSSLDVSDRNTDNGVPMPYIDTQRP